MRWLRRTLLKFVEIIEDYIRIKKNPKDYYYSNREEEDEKLIPEKEEPIIIDVDPNDFIDYIEEEEE